MSAEPAFQDLMDRLRQGDPLASQQIFERFARGLINLARRRLDVLIRQKVDPEDVMLSAFKSFFLRHAQGQFQFDSWDSLWSLLTLITLRKCGHKIDYFRAACRDVKREQALPAGESDSDSNWEAIARDPTPSEAAVLAETLERILGSLDGRDRTIVELLLQGCSAPEISAQIGRSERTVHRLVERTKKKLRATLSGAPPSEREEG